MKPRYRAALAAAALAIVVPVSGCAALLSAQQTQEYRYNGGDGVWESFADGIEVRGVLLIANEDASEAQLFYTIVNNSARNANVEISVGDFTETFSVAAGQTLSQNPADPTAENVEEKLVTGYDAVTGEQVDVDITVNGESKTLRAQVLDADLWYYENLAPSGQESTSASEAASEGATEEATEEPSADPTAETTTEAATGAEG